MVGGAGKGWTSKEQQESGNTWTIENFPSVDMCGVLIFCHLHPLCIGATCDRIFNQKGLCVIPPNVFLFCHGLFLSASSQYGGGSVRHLCHKVQVCDNFISFRSGLVDMRNTNILHWQSG